MKKACGYATFWPSLTLLSVIAAWAVFHWDALLSLHRRWIRLDEPYAVGYPVAAIALWWIVRHYQILQARRSSPSVVAFIGLCAVLLVGIAATLVQIQLVQQLAALASLWLIFAGVLGWSAGRLLLFPVMVLMIGIPVWDFLVDPLRIMTVWFTQHMLNWLTVPAYIDGYFITLPSGVIEVAGGCSGMNLLLAMALLGLLSAESGKLSYGRRTAVMCIALAMGIFENWVRVFLLVLLGYTSNMQSELLHNHGNFGWWIFALGLPVYFWIVYRIEGRGASGAGAASVAPTAQSGVGLRGAGVMPAVILATVLGALALEQSLMGRVGRAVAGFEAPAGSVPATPEWLPSYTGQDFTQAWRMAVGDTEFEVVALTYIRQGPQKKLIYFSNRLADERQVAHNGVVRMQDGAVVNTAFVNVRGWRKVWWYWWVDGDSSTSALRTKLLQLKALISGDPSSALIAVSTPCHELECRDQPMLADEAIGPVLNMLQGLRPAQAR